MGLADYVKRKMKEKKLSGMKVSKNSGGAISDTYVLKIAAGKVPRPSMSRLKALAKGLKVPERGLFREAGFDVEAQAEKEWTAQESHELMGALLKNKELREGAVVLARMEPERLKRALKYLKKE